MSCSEIRVTSLLLKIIADSWLCLKALGDFFPWLNVYGTGHKCVSLRTQTFCPYLLLKPNKTLSEAVGMCSFHLGCAFFKYFENPILCLSQQCSIWLVVWYLLTNSFASSKHTNPNLSVWSVTSLCHVSLKYRWIGLGFRYQVVFQFLKKYIHLQQHCRISVGRSTAGFPFIHLCQHILAILLDRSKQTGSWHHIYCFPEFIS